MTPITEPLARRVRDTIRPGLILGSGGDAPGKVCLENAICLALGEEPNDEPSCVGTQVRQFSIELNDSFRWGGDADRAEGMLKFGIAQLGSDQIDQGEFARLVAIGTVNRILPPLLRDIAPIYPWHRERLESAANLCAAAKTTEDAVAAARAAYLASPNESIEAVSSRATIAAEGADATSAAMAAQRAAEAAASHNLTPHPPIYYLHTGAEIGLQALITLKSPGCDYLWLCNEPPTGPSQ